MALEKLRIEGPGKLFGELGVQGAKNSTLPLLAASLLCGAEAVLHNCPLLSDVDTAVRILTTLGCRVRREGHTLVIDSSSLSGDEIPENLMREMRSSIVFLGAIVSRLGKAKLSFPGGCELGPRPIDLHLEALRKMGVCIRENHGCLECSVPGGLRGCPISLSFPSVGATENVMLAAVCARGVTVLSNAAREPEIEDLANFLNACGGRVSGAGGSVIVIEGVESLGGCEHRVIGDRIVAATYLAATAAAGGEVLLRDVEKEHLQLVLPVFEEAGCNIRASWGCLQLKAPERLRPVKCVRTMPYPGFPTDAQAPVMAMTCLADGTSVFVENIFESRYKHAGELMRLGANIKVEGRVAVVEGVPSLWGASVEAPDLRGGAALLIAGLAAEGTTTLSGLHHLDRGYEAVEENFRALGGRVWREST